MPYIGKNPVGGGFHKLDALTASATATYALTLNSAAYFPESANQLLVSLNGVIQAPQDSFTVSGSNLVFDTALTASDSIDFVVALGDVLAVKTVTDGAITTAKLGNGAVTKAKMGTTELDLATIKDGTGTNTAMTIDSTGRILTPARPAFHAYKSDDPNLVSSGTYVFNSTFTNIGNCYDTTTGRFTAPVNGVYVFSTTLQMYGANGGRYLEFFKNGAQLQSGVEIYGQTPNATTHQVIGYNAVLELVATDYITVDQNGFRGMQSHFSGYLLG